MNVLISHNPRGKLHAISADHPAGHAATFSAVQAAAEPGSEREVPAVGVEIVKSVIGWCTVTHHIILDGQRVAVATGPRGSGLVREWRPATPEDRPHPLRPAHDPEPVHAPEVVHASTTVDTPRPARMVSLFDFGGGA